MSENTIPEIPELPEVPEISEMPAIPVLEDIPPVGIEPGDAPGGLVDPRKDWMAIAALVCGVLSLCGAVFAPLGCLLSVAAVVLGILGMKSTKRTLAIIGLAAGGLGILLSLVFGVITGASLFMLEGSY